MLQRSSLTTPTATEIAGTLQQTLERSALRSLQNLLQLPESWQQYLVLLGVIALIGAGIVTQVLLTAQIAEAESTLRSLRSEYQWIQYENSELIHQIATRSSLAQIQRRAADLGYIPATSRTFVYRSDVPALGMAATITTLPDVASEPEIVIQPGPPTPAQVPAEPVAVEPQPWWETARLWLTQRYASLVPGAAGQGGAHDGLDSP